MWLGNVTEEQLEKHRLAQMTQMNQPQTRFDFSRKPTRINVPAVVKIVSPSKALLEVSIGHKFAGKKVFADRNSFMFVDGQPTFMRCDIFCICFT